jgi:subtilase family serine protease
MLRTLTIVSKATRHTSTLAAAMAALFSPVFLSAQVMPRITGPVEDAAMVTLKGNTHPLAKPQFDRGAVADSASGRMLLVLKRSPQQEQALRTFVESQRDQGSPNFHKWLTPEQFGEKFGVADADIATVSDYLQAHGFGVGRVYANKMAIEVTGTAGQLRDTFQTQIHSYNIRGQQYFANASDPRIPSALAPVVAGFASLNNIRAIDPSRQPATSLATTFEPATHRFKPEYTGSNSSGVYYLVAPADVQKIYDVPPYVLSGGQPTTTLSGAGVTVGVINDAQINVNLVTQYQTLGGLSVNAPVELIDGNDPIDATLSSDAVNAYEQLELVSAAAPGAALLYYASGTTDYDTGIDFAIIRAVQDNIASVLVTSAQSCELALGASGNYFIYGEWLQAAAQGITVVAATGDSGSAACDTPGSATSTGGLAVNGYASTPYNTAVGGTDFYYGSRTGGPTYWGSTTQNNNFYESALGYIPEQAWNDSIINAADSNPSNLPSAVYGSGGGYSTIGSYTEFGTVGSPYPIQPWQSSFVTGTARAIPDVAFFAGNNYNSAQYAVCAAPGDCILNNGVVSSVTDIGGTAGAAGVFAGIMADVVQKMGARQGSVNPTLYALHSTANIYHDTTIGSNSMNCTAGTGCNGTNLVAGSPSTNAYLAKASWDAATGLGSVDAAKLIAAWTSLATKTTTTALTITAYPGGPAITKTVHGTGLAFFTRVSPTSGTGTPTGNVALNTSSPLPDYGSITTLPLVSGQGVSLQDYFLPGGTYNVTASYPGDTTYEASTSPAIPITVTPEPSQLEIISSNPASGGTAAYGSPVSITIEPYSLTKSNVSTPTGTISVFNGGSYPIQILPLNDEGAATYYSSILMQGSYSFTFKYSGDPSYAPSEITAGFPLTVGLGNSVTTLSETSATASATGKGNGTVTISAIVANAGSGYTGIAPTGQVRFNTNPTQTINLVSGFNTGNQAVGIATTTVSSVQVPKNGAALTATYLGDANYATSTSNSLPLAASSTTYVSTSTIALTPNATTVAANGTLSITATVNVAGVAAAGTVQFFANGILLNATPFAVTGGSGTYTVPLVNNYLPIVSGTVKLTAIFTPSLGTASPSTSAGVNITITDDRTNSDFSVSTDFSTQTLSPTSSNSYFQTQVTSIANFSALNFPITLSCTTPSGSNLNCIFPDSTNTNQSTITVYVGASGVVLTPVKVSGFPSVVTATTVPQQPLQQKWWFLGGGSTLACVLLFGIPARRKGWQGMLTILVCAAFVTSSITGCGGTSLSQSLTKDGSSTIFGGGSNLSGTANATGGGVAANLVTPGKYQVVITGTSTTSNTTLIHNTPVNVVVSSTPTLPNGTYSLTSINSQLLVTDLNANANPGTSLVQEAVDGTTDQQWIFTYQSGGYYTITSAAHPSLYVTEASAPGSGTNATLQTATGDSSQLWAFSLVEGGYEVINGNPVANGSTPGVLDDNAFGATPGTTVLVFPQKDITQSINQTWYIH